MAVIQDLKMILSNATTTCITNARTYTEEKARYRAVVDYVNQLERHDQEIRNEAITEFAERLKKAINENYFFAGEFKRWTLNVVDEIAEEMRGAE